MSKINTAKLKSVIPIDSYYQEQLGSPAKTNSNHWVYLCPFHDDEKNAELGRLL